MNHIDHLAWLKNEVAALQRCRAEMLDDRGWTPAAFQSGDERISVFSAAVAEIEAARKKGTT